MRWHPAAAQLLKQAGPDEAVHRPLCAVHGEEPQRHSRRLPLSAFKCVKSRNDLHNDSCHVAVLVELADKIPAMAGTGRWYILGPPVQRSHDVVDVVSHVIRQITKYCSVEDVEGPVPYDASWVAGGRKPDRKGMIQAVLRWTGSVKWSDSAPRSFTFVVMDHLYLSNGEADRDDTEAVHQ